jgi:hypothetical protein
MKLNYSVDLNSINNSPSVKDADRAIDIQSKLGNILANRQPMNPGQGAQVAPAASNDGFGRTN